MRRIGDSLSNFPPVFANSISGQCISPFPAPNPNSTATATIVGLNQLLHDRSNLVAITYSRYVEGEDDSCMAEAPLFRSYFPVSYEGYILAQDVALRAKVDLENYYRDQNGHTGARAIPHGAETTAASLGIANAEFANAKLFFLDWDDMPMNILFVCVRNVWLSPLLHSPTSSATTTAFTVHRLPSSAATLRNWKCKLRLECTTSWDFGSCVLVSLLRSRFCSLLLRNCTCSCCVEFAPLFVAVNESV